MKRSMLFPTGILIVFFLVGVYAPPPEKEEHVSTREPEPTETYANTENWVSTVTKYSTPRNSITEAKVRPNPHLTTPPPPLVKTTLNFNEVGQFVTNSTWGLVKNRVIEGRSAVKDAIDRNIISRVYTEFGAAMQEIAVLQSSRRDSVFEDGAELVELMGYMLRFFQEPVFIYAGAINKLSWQMVKDLRTLASLKEEIRPLKRPVNKGHHSLINAQFKLHLAYKELDYCRNVTNPRVEYSNQT